ncbi:MAG TPA: glycosyltransferase [Solirubrobacteraceae bacterium]|nr:glycosyltransferase [Solirubrobacteraceae bacterium]
MRICLIYDCLFPYTVGGAERWYRNLAERLVTEGHEVTYLTLRQWPRDEPLDVDPRIRVVVAGPRMALYAGPRRRILPPLVFGAGVLWHLLRHGRDYDVVHTCAFPYFSLLGAALARPLGGYGLVVDWFEVWSRQYWRGYLGGVGGRVGELVQWMCTRVPQRAFCFSQLHAKRLHELGLHGPITVLRGLYAGSKKATCPPRARGASPFEQDPTETTLPPAPRSDQLSAGAPATSVPTRPSAPEPFVLFAGRLIPEKRVTVGVAAVARAARRIEGLRGVFYGDGPERDALAAAIAELDAGAFISAPGFGESEQVDADMSRALCVLLPSEREGYGMVVVEASAHATPAVVVAAPDNAAVELVEQGVNGVIASSADPEAIAEAIVRVHEAGMAMRESTAQWFAENSERLSLESSLRSVVDGYTTAARP